MTQQTILKQFLSLSAHVVEIARPLNSSGIEGLFYMRVYPDGTVINLSSNPEWSEYYFQRYFKGHYSEADIADQVFIEDGISLWALNEQNRIWLEGRERFGFGNGVTLCEKNNRFTEITSFYSMADNRAMNHYYINQTDMIKKTKSAFIACAASLIDQAEQSRQSLCFPIYQSSPDNTAISTSDVEKLDNNICLIHKETLRSVNLSPQRSRCLSYIMAGMSAKQIAIEMDLSAKTVEHYIDFLRKTLGCRTSKDLILSYANQVGLS